jgi:vacuolar-type H+-ATPase subunit E/Vma4
MEEIASTDALEKEILEDARKKGEKILRDGEAEAARIRSEFEGRSASALAALAEDFRSRTERYEGENLARLPLERGRLKATYIDRLLGAAMEYYLAALPADKVAGLVGGLLARAAGLVGDSRVTVGYKGMDEAAARSLVSANLPEARVLSSAKDEGLPAAGILVVSEGGRLSVRATMDLVGERLLDEHRGELARTLCGEALAL